MGWFLVIAAALMETVGVIGLKRYSGHKSLLNATLFFGGFGASFVLLYQSFRYIQLSIAYAVWIGLGTAAAVLVNMLASHRPPVLVTPSIMAGQLVVANSRAAAVLAAVGVVMVAVLVMAQLPVVASCRTSGSS